MQAVASTTSQGRKKGNERGKRRGKGRGERVPKPRSLFRSLNRDAIHTIDVPSDEAVSQDEPISIKDVETIGSYSWLEKSVKGVPRILVPGSPRYWVDKIIPYNVKRDQGVSWVDQNGYMMPNSVLLPAVAAVNTFRKVQGQKPFAWSNVDIFTDRSNLRKLFEWAKGKKYDFRIDIQLAGRKTLLMSRFSKRFQESGAMTQYGFSFEKTSTVPAPGCQDSDGHRHIITYDFNGLKLVVCFEADACIAPTRDHDNDSIEDILESVGTTEKKFGFGDPLIVRLGGTVIPEQDIIELKTRANALDTYIHIKWKDIYSQLFFSQTPHLYLGEHRDGLFYKITKYSMSSSPQLQSAEDKNHTTLQKVHKTLHLIKEFVIAQGPDARLSLVCKDKEMKVYRRTDGGSLLPQALLDLF